MGNSDYQKFIKEAFIDPIRSVLIVDDDYPTYNDILNQSDTANSKKTWSSQTDRIAKVIGVFRHRSPPLLVDIHDDADVSSENEVATATHLHQCDLLVLDYVLDKGKPNDGTRAIEILRGLMSNNHFNLVIIYTNEDLYEVFNTVRWGLITSSTDNLSESEVDKAIELIYKSETDVENFERHLYETIGATQYFHSRANQSSYLRTMSKDQEPYKLFYVLAKQVGWSRDQRRLVLRYLLKSLENKNGVQNDQAGCIDNLQWSRNDPNWIKSDSAFVALSSKTDNHDDLLSDLQKALNNWKPRPSRLFLTKLRAEIDDYGVAAQGPALSNHNALAYWYYLLLTTDSDNDRRWQVKESVSRHSDQLLQTILPRVEDFASRLIDSEVAAGNSSEICINHFGVNLRKVDDRKKAALEHNVFVCSMEPVGVHLTTGHVFAMSNEHWLCLSPACDMVPSQISHWRANALGEHLPFIAVMLHSIKPTKELSDIHSNRYLFLRVEGQLKIFCFNNPSKKESGPQWDLLYAENRGVFSEESFQFTVSCIEQGDSKLVFNQLEAKVIGQLRYEYALNLIQKLGVSLTRVGLDFADGTKELA